MSPSRAQKDIDPLTDRVDASQRYLIDLKGYLVIRNALTKSETEHLNRVIDEQLLPPPSTYNRFGSAPLGSGFLGWHPSFVSLIDHGSVIDVLQFLLGPLFTLRTIYGIYEDRFVGKALTDELCSSVKIGAETSLECCVIWNMTDSGPGIGGFCCIEGSHHVRGDVPASIHNDRYRSPFVVTPEAPAGSAIVCTSRLLQGNGIWQGPHQRRSLVFEYTTEAESDTGRRIAVPSFDLSRRQLAILSHSNM